MAHLNTEIAYSWFLSKNWTVFPFQQEAWNNYLDGKSGIVNAPTGSGKTYSLLIPAILEGLNKKSDKLQVIWITPIRALAKEIYFAADRAIKGLNSDWRVELRTGDTTTASRQKQWINPPQILITTPESIHVMFATKGYKEYFKHLKSIIVDEWHELIGSKRGVQMELAISRLRGLNPSLKVWGISATIGNLDEAVQVLLGNTIDNYIIIKADIEKKIEVVSLIPDEIERFPWTGHLGLKMLEKVIPIIHQSKATLIFTNTRAQCEIWYQKILEKEPDLAGLIAMHHGSISRELRDWVEDSLYEGILKAVVCTSSLDLGVDFRPVETIIQIGSPKGVARFIQRAGRSGHNPGAISKIYFSPTHALELIEAAALRTSISNQQLEERIPYIRSFDVLIQYLMTLAVSDGFAPNEIYSQIKSTYSYDSLTKDEWLMVLNYIRYGGKSLHAYDEYKKVEVDNGIYKVANKSVALRHRLSIGTIVSDAMINVSYVGGKKLGSIEEWFISQLNPSDVFWFAGRSLELVRIKDLTAQVKDAKNKNGRIPSYMGGRLPLSSQMSKVLRDKIDAYNKGYIEDNEIKSIIPLLELQQQRSLLPTSKILLAEYFKSDEGYHLIIYPFEGRNVHEGMAALLAKRISNLMPITFSLSMNDYGFELLSDKKIDVHKIIDHKIFNVQNLIPDINASINAVEMARRKFRDIAVISGLVFQGFPGKPIKERHLQSSSQLLFTVFKDYEPDNLLYLQTYEEVATFQLEEGRMRAALERIQQQKIVIKELDKPSPFSFPLIVDRLREKMSSEQLEERVKRMTIELEKN
jgi:ATP-dependent Lhr-like helicase